MIVGENIIQLKENPDAVGIYTGTLILEEDFSFEVTCQDTLSSFEPIFGVRN